MTDMLERMALAINAELKRQWEAQPAPGREFDPNSWTSTGGVIDLRKLAKAALREVRKPTREMLETAQQARHRRAEMDKNIDLQQMYTNKNRAAWQAMIDHILSEE